MSREDLRKEAFTPYKFEDSMLKSCVSDMSRHRFILQTGATGVNAAKLVPGGRWLVLVAQRANYSCWIQVWDLDSPNERPAELVASYNITTASDSATCISPESLHVQPAAGGEEPGFILVVLSMNSGDDEGSGTGPTGRCVLLQRELGIGANRLTRRAILVYRMRNHSFISSNSRRAWARSYLCVAS